MISFKKTNKQIEPRKLSLQIMQTLHSTCSFYKLDMNSCSQRFSQAVQKYFVFCILLNSQLLDFKVLSQYLILLLSIIVSPFILISTHIHMYKRLKLFKVLPQKKFIKLIIIFIVMVNVLFTLFLVKYVAYSMLDQQLTDSF